MNHQEQQAYITDVYQRIFKDKETGTETEVSQKIEDKVRAFFTPVYEQWSNNLHYDYNAFLCHVKAVNAQSDAHFAIEFLSSNMQGPTNIVTVRTVVTDAATGDFLSGVVSSWAFNPQRKMLWCKETLFATLESDDCGENQDPRNWPADVTV